MKIFGIGLSRTGTTSLSAALEMLGYKIAHYPNEPVTNSEIVGGVLRLKLLEDCDGLVDTPVPAIFPGLDQAWPGSKFILTTREFESWLNSARAFFCRSDSVVKTGLERNYKGLLRAMVYGTPNWNEAVFRYVWDSHHRNVREYFKDRPGDFLVLSLEADDPWRLLCGFLGRDVPDAPYPWLNRGSLIS